ncbi:hypothetical protein LTR09_003703 [Extremus antarcticus]|uniref:Heme haloperoxidase family profile domain-containing protein n=1 Tax=Extremus antarcticus TaxID=702011 RepID=A0AAJ0GA39_9PEZI|nr:hypothetical protein LTR09_003703 [Extremus antarcticus]
MAFQLRSLGGGLAFPSPPSHWPAWPGHTDHHEPTGHEFAPPGPLDSRSPCPGLNALANHAWLPRSGLNISYEDIQYAATNGYNFSSDAYLFAFLQANETYGLSTTGNTLTINLQDLATHNAIEQDGSQSRNDIYFGDNLHYDPTVFGPVAANLGLNDISRGNAYVTVESAAKARAAREVEAKRVNPEFNDTLSDFTTLGTAGLYLATLWDFDAKAAPKLWVKAFFEEDRIAYREGYTALKVKSGGFIVELVNAVTKATM